MGCDLSHLGVIDVDSIVVLKFFSTTDSQPPRAWDPAYIPDTNVAYVNELEMLGQAVTGTNGLVMEVSQYSVVGDVPYSSRLRPLSSLNKLFVKRCAHLVSMEFNAVEATTDPPGADQDAPTVQAILDSVDPSAATFSNARAYMQPRFRRSVMGGWQPNWFRPVIRIDGKSIIFDALSQVAESISQSPTGANRGDMSVGLLLPYCWKGDIRLGVIQQSIEVFAAAYQYIDDTSMYQRYPIDCEMVIYLEDESTKTECDPIEERTAQWPTGLAGGRR